MRNFKRLLEEIYSHTKIPFMVKINGEEIFNKISKEELLESMIKAEVLEIGKNKICIITLERDGNCMSLLKYLIGDKLHEYFKSNEMLIKRILNGEEIKKEDIEAEITVVKDSFYLIDIFIDRGRLEIAKEVIDKLYKNNEVVNLIYKDHILLLGDFDNVLDHINSILEVIESNVYSECYISYRTISNVLNLKEDFKIISYKVMLAKKNKLSKRVFGDDDLFLESMVDNINSKFKYGICKEFDNKLKMLDDELLRTIDMFYKAGLNLSEGAKNLYIHRNTLIYRIEKIQKITGYDIREFNQAVEFKMIISIWKENLLTVCS
ncbi:PucR family transcriptional regulator [Clostridium chrysemydis]|uniref:PucR family transcriptional regulator n=1 Tax=Clostridium chrysemydis TaxID=2665504 RepID=UPI001883420A|nr:helix-turn-helix domain-containing protein [Clostridium chrysemydis]